jgi:hypothetical protein
MRAHTQVGLDANLVLIFLRTQQRNINTSLKKPEQDAHLQANSSNAAVIWF